MEGKLSIVPFNPSLISFNDNTIVRYFYPRKILPFEAFQRFAAKLQTFLLIMYRLKFVSKYFIISVRSVYPCFRYKILFQLVEYLYCGIKIISCNLLVMCYMVVTNKSCILSVVSWLVFKELLKERSRTSPMVVLYSDNFTDWLSNVIGELKYSLHKNS